MKKLLIFFIAVLPIFAKSQTLTAIRDNVKNGYRFWLYEPKTDSIKTLKPLILFLHGQSLTGNNLYNAKRYGPIDAIEMGRQINAYVLNPQLPGGTWSPEKLLNVLNWTTERYPVDTNRIYVIGMSAGGYGTLNFVGTYPEKVAAAMALCGGSSLLKDFCGLTKVPLWIIHGTADRDVPVAQSQKVVNNMIACGDTSLLIFDKWSGANHGFLAKLFYTPETYRWLFLHSLADSVRTVHREISITKNTMKTAYMNFDKSATKFTLIDNSQTLHYKPEAKEVSKIHIVQKGDTLSQIARKYHTSVSALCNLNNIKSTSILQIGQKIKIG